MSSAPASLDFFGESPAPAAAAPAAAAAAPNTLKVVASGADEWKEEDVRSFRKRLRLKVESEDECVPRPWASWSDGAMEDVLFGALEAFEWRNPTAVQSQSCPVLMAGADALVTAPTGSGKTGAFAIPLVSSLLKSASETPTTTKKKKKKKTSKKTTTRAGPVAAVIAPTRELVSQIAREVRRLLSLCGVEDTVAMAPWTDEAFGRSSVVVSTPKALLDAYGDRAATG